MTFSEALVADFEVTCVQCVGRVLPLNNIDYDPDTGHGYLSHIVNDNHPAVQCVDGRFVREIILEYDASGMTKHIRRM